MIKYIGFKEDRQLLPEDKARNLRKQRWIHLRQSKRKSVYCYPESSASEFHVEKTYISKSGELCGVSADGTKVVCLSFLILFSENNWWTDEKPFVSDYIDALVQG